MELLKSSPKARPPLDTGYKDFSTRLLIGEMAFYLPLSLVSRLRIFLQSPVATLPGPQTFPTRNYKEAAKGKAKAYCLAAGASLRINVPSSSRSSPCQVPIRYWLYLAFNLLLRPFDCFKNGFGRASRPFIG